jgi:hypothetical protein
MALLLAKGLLYTNQKIRPDGRARVDVADAVWAGTEVEPRIIEVLPAAILRFPKNFYNLEALPEALQKIVGQIKGGETGEDYEGLKFKDMARWAAVPLKDKRGKPVQEKRVPKLFNLKPETVKALREFVARGEFTDMTEAIDELVAARLKA